MRGRRGRKRGRGRGRHGVSRAGDFGDVVVEENGGGFGGDGEGLKENGVVGDEKGGGVGLEGDNGLVELEGDSALGKEDGDGFCMVVVELGGGDVIFESNGEAHLMEEQVKDGGDCLEDGGGEPMEGGKCHVDLGSTEQGNNEGSVCVLAEKEQRPRKKRRLSDRMKAKQVTPLRRSARRAAITGSPAPSNDIIASEKSSCPDSDAPVQESTEKDSEGGVPKLPPSSTNPNLDGLLVLDVFSVYSCLRSFSTLLFLSPFSLEAFVGALRCSFANSLIDSVHFSILQALKVHVERLSDEGTESASNCLRGLNWKLLDLFTWPVYLAEYLLLHGSSMKPCFKLTELKLLDGEYYRQSAVIKLEILRCLCDDVVEAELFRSELRRRVLETEPDADNEQNTPYESKNKDSTPNDVPSSPSHSIDEETIDWNNDECCLCKLEGSLICCDGCPAAFHSRCVGVACDTLPEGDWYCPDCSVGKVDQPVRPPKPRRGAELLGVDIHGRLFLGSCGYLLVSDSCGADSYHYYHKNDLNSVIEVLLTPSHTLYAGIIMGICKYWGIPCDSICPGFGIQEWKESDCDFSLLCTQPSQLKGDIVPKKSNLKNSGYQGYSISKSRKFNSESVDNLPGFCYPSTCFDSILENSQSTTIQMPLTSPDNCPINPDSGVMKELSSQTNDQMKSHGTQMQCDPNGYINYYRFGRIASSIAEEIACKSPEDINKGLESSAADTISSQKNTIFKKVVGVGWSVIQKLSLDVQKERCGWCFTCKNSDNQDCLFNLVENKFLEGPKNSEGPKILEGLKNLPVGLRSVKNRKSHMISAIHNCLAIEDNIQGLLSGPWDNPHYRKYWRTGVLKSTDIASLKQLLLALESNMRRIVLSAEWLKPADNDSTVGSASHILTSAGNASSRKLAGRRRARKSTSERKKNCFETGNDSGSHVATTSSIYWWRGGRLSRQLFNWKLLPRSMAFKCGRQAGCQKVPGIYYPDGSELAKRSKYVAWRAAVEMSGSVADLILHVRDLDSNIRWNDLKNTQTFSCSAKEFKKQARALKNVTICRKHIEGNQVNYVLNFGRKKSIPDIITKQASMHQETSSGRKKYWLNESIIPLGLLKAFELKKLERKDGKLDKKVPFDAVGKCKTTKRKRLSIFSYLFSKVQNMYCKCGDCNEDIPKREAVSCEFCGGFFHKKHFRVPKGVTDAAYMCLSCQHKEAVKLKSKEQKNKANVKLKSKKQKQKATVKLKIKKLTKQAKWTKRVAATKSKPISRREKSLDMKGQKAIKSKRFKKAQPQSKVNTTLRNISWYRGKRTPTHHSYWLNGLLRARKEGCERGIIFKSTKVLMPFSDTRDQKINPMCNLCHKEYNPDLIYLGCENCGDWFHGVSLEITIENIKNISGFKCYKCRCNCPPVCPCVRSGSTSKVDLLRESNAGEESLIDTYLHEAGPIDGEYLHENNKPKIEEHAEQDIQHTDSNLLHMGIDDEQMVEATGGLTNDVCLWRDDKAQGTYAKQDLQHVNSKFLQIGDSIDDEQMAEAIQDADQYVNNYSGDCLGYHSSASNMMVGSSDFVRLREDIQYENRKDVKQEFPQSCEFVSQGDSVDEDEAHAATSNKNVPIVGDYNEQNVKHTNCNSHHTGDSVDNEQMMESIPDTGQFLLYNESSPENHYRISNLGTGTADCMHALYDAEPPREGNIKPGLL